MADSPFSFIFSPTGEGGVPTYGELEQRRKIAAAIAGRKRPYPDTIGAGIASFGESLSEGLYDRQTRQLERESGDYTNRLVGSAAQPTTIQPAPYRGADDEPYIQPRPPAEPPAQTAPPAAAQPPAFPAPLPGQGGTTSTLPGQGASMAPATGLAGLAALGTAAQPGSRESIVQTLANPTQANQMDTLMGGTRPPPAAAGSALASRDTGTTTDAPRQIPPMGGAGGPTQQPPPPAAQTQVAQAAPPPLWATSPTTQAPIVPPPPPLPAPQQPPATAASAGIERAPPRHAMPEIPPPQRRPGDPNLLPMVNPRIQQWNTIATDRRVDPAIREQFQQRIKDEQSQIKAHNDLQVQGHTATMTDWRAADAKRRDPMQIMQVEKLRRELLDQGYTPMSPEEAQKLMPMGGSLSPGQTVWMNAAGQPTFGPAPPSNVTATAKVEGSKAPGKGFEKLHETAAGVFSDAFKTATTAQDELQQLTEFRALSARMPTGPLAVAKLWAGKAGIATEGLSEVQAMDALINRAIPAQHIPGTGPATDFDGRTFRGAIQQLMNTPGGNDLVMNTMEGLINNKIARGAIMGKIMSGEMGDESVAMANGVKEMMRLQLEAKGLSDKVKIHLETNGIKVPEKAIPPVKDLDAQAEQWLKDNPNHPDREGVLRSLGR